MPFTPAHAAAYLPFRRMGFAASAFIVGTLAPDFGYFVLLGPHHVGHRWPGVLLYTLPASLLALWLFHTVLKRPLAALLPVSMEEHVKPLLGPFAWGPLTRFARIVLSAAAGIATHILWDAFTHRDSPLAERWPLLLRMVNEPFIGPRHVYTVLQHLSSVLGLVALTVWFALWMRRTPATNCAPGEVHRSSASRLLFVAMLFVIAAALAFARVVWLLRVPDGNPLIVLLVINTMAFFALELIAYSLWWNGRAAFRS